MLLNDISKAPDVLCFYNYTTFTVQYTPMANLRGKIYKGSTY